MPESSVYQDIIAKGIEQGIELGRKAFAIESILELLEARFQATPAAIMLR